MNHFFLLLGRNQCSECLLPNWSLGCTLHFLVMTSRTHSVCCPLWEWAGGHSRPCFAIGPYVCFRAVSWRRHLTCLQTRVFWSSSPSSPVSVWEFWFLCSLIEYLWCTEWVASSSLPLMHVVQVLLLAENPGSCGCPGVCVCVCVSVIWCNIQPSE